MVNINLFLHKALSFAVGEGILVMNPTEAVNLPRGPRPQVEILTRDEQCIMENEALRKYISFSDRYTLEKLLSCGETLLGNDVLWVKEVKAIMKQLQNRRARGYA